MRCGRRKHSFWQNPVGELLSYLTEPRSCANRNVAIAHNAKAFDLYFILNRTIMLKWKPENIMNGQKIMCLEMEHLSFSDSVSFLPCPLRNLSEAFGLTACKSWYSNYFNTEENLDYVGPIPDVSYYGVNEMGEEERMEFLARCESQETIFDNRRVLESYCQEDFTIVREACRVFGRELMEIGNIKLFKEAIKIASACNNFLRKRFLYPDTIGLIPTGG